MNDSQLIVHTVKASYFCCCYDKQTTIALAGSLSLDLFDLVVGNKICSFQFKIELAPISVKKINNTSDYSTFFVQDKSGLILIINFDEKTCSFSLGNQYHIEMIGFTKLPLVYHSIDNTGRLTKSIRESFITLNYPNKLQLIRLNQGTILKSFQLEEEQQLTDVTFMLRISFDSHDFLIVAEEGALLKKICLPSEGDNIKNIQKLPLKTEKQIRIVLWIEVIDNYRALATLREDKLVEIDIKALSVLRNYDLTFGRIIKSLNSESTRFFMAGKQIIAILNDFKTQKTEKLHTMLIMDIQICEYGAFGVCQEGKIFFLPF